MWTIEDGISKALSYLNIQRQGRILLKKEQETATKDLLSGNDVLAVLPTGFGKSLTYTIFALAREEIMSTNTCAIIISPLKSIIDDQIAEMESLNCKAMELTSDNIASISTNPPQFLYCTAEMATDKRFLDILKDKNSALHAAVSAIVVDECHTVESSTGRRKKQSTKPQVFRSAYGKLSILRSMCKEGTPVLALTGTADKDTERTVVTNLIMRNPVELFVSPTRTNLRLSVNKVPKTEMLKQLDWLVALVKQYGKDTHKTIIFGDTLYAVASVMNYLMMSLGANAFHPNTSKKRQDCLLGIFHSLSLKEYKERLLASFKGDGVKRLAIATTALSMGVNFPNVRYIVLFGPARSLLDFHQQAGRAGRDGQPSDVIVYYYGQQLAHCEDDVRTFLKATGCHRVASYSSLDSSIIPLLPSHDCCNCCAAVCLCNGANNCTSPEKPFEKRSPEETVLMRSRTVSDNQRDFLKGALSEMEASMSCGVGKGVFGSTTFHGFSQELITDVVAKCDRLFTVDDLKTFVPVFSKNHALRILEILDEVFNDIDECTLTDPVNNFYGDEECFFPGLDELFTSSHGDFLEEFSVDPDTIPE